jgi:uncharacterized protein (TIGR03437 family)
LASSAFGADYTTYIGDEFPYRVAAITTDSAGNTYVTGSRNGALGVPTANFAVLLPANSTPPPSPPPPDVFLTKLDPAGNIVFTTTISGKGSDQANAIALDPSGNIYIAGTTSSANFPLRDALQTEASPSGTGFIVKLSPDGGTVFYSTFFGGTLGPSSVNALAVDAKGNLYVTGYTYYVTGYTYASDFPTTAGLPAGHVGFYTVPITSGAFFAKIASAGTQILYAGLIAGQNLACPGGGGSSCFLSSRSTVGAGIAVDASGNAYIAGNTNTIDLMGTTGTLLAQGTGAFVTKVNASGTALAYLTFLGATSYGAISVPSSPANAVLAIAADSAGNAYLTGSTSDPRFPATANSYQPVYAGPATPPPLGSAPPADAFVAKLKPDGSGMVWATYLGGPSADAGQSLAVDSSGNVWVTGTTSSLTFPNADGWTPGGDFLVEVDSTGSALSYSAEFPSGSTAQAVALVASGSVQVAGQGGLVSTIRTVLPPVARIFGIVNAAGGPITGRISPGELISIYGPSLGPLTPVPASPDGSGLFPKSLGGVQVTIDGIAAPLLYVSLTQINAVVPFGVTSDAATVQVANGGSARSAFRAIVDSTAPAIFTNAAGNAAVNQNGTINSASNPAKRGSVIGIWATGTGVASRTDGQVSAGAQNDCSSCSPYVDFASVGVLYAGSAPGLVAGITQIDFYLPETAPAAQSVLVILAAGGRSSAGILVYIAP